MKIPGRVITVNLANVHKITCDEIWHITRAGPDVPSLIRVRELSPSKKLFQQAQRWKEDGIPKSEWWPLYEAEFRKELKTVEKRRALSHLWRLLCEGKTVALVCLCKDHRKCHRRLVGDELTIHGVEVTEAFPVEAEQLSLF